MYLMPRSDVAIARCSWNSMYKLALIDGITTCVASKINRVSVVSLHNMDYQHNGLIQGIQLSANLDLPA